MTELIRPILETFRFNTGLLSLGLEDLNSEDAVRRWKHGEGSSIAYLVGHVSSSRIGVLKALGHEVDNPYKETFGAGVGAKDGAEYPSVDELHTGWVELGERLTAALAAVSDDQALAPPTASFPTADQSLRGQLAFIAWHESYHLGQIGILRTEMGYPSLRQALIRSKRS